jgi:predicted cupin superfamily sugar epimerase
MPLPPKIKDLISALDLIPHPEGGFFTETYRSGSEPMSTMGQTGFHCEHPDINLVVANGRRNNRPDGDERRNALTSIYWVPTMKSPKLLLAYNCSDHVHYYQGGRPFKYSIYDPESGKLSEMTLGPELHKGHKPQIAVRGGLWKCGMMETDCDDESLPENEYEYSLIGEAVAPGFDFHDFTWVTETLLRKTCNDDRLVNLFLPFIHERSSEILKDNKTVDDAVGYYEDDKAKEQRIKERS